MSGGACMTGSIHGRGHAWLGECMMERACMARGMGGRGACMAGRVCMAGGHALAGEMATAAGGMLCTGMHSCLVLNLFITRKHSSMMHTILSDDHD